METRFANSFTKLLKNSVLLNCVTWAAHKHIGVWNTFTKIQTTWYKRQENLHERSSEQSINTTEGAFSGTSLPIIIIIIIISIASSGLNVEFNGTNWRNTQTLLSSVRLTCSVKSWNYRKLFYLNVLVHLFVFQLEGLLGVACRRSSVWHHASFSSCPFSLLMRILGDGTSI